MEYIQTILVQVEATRLEQASQPEGLLSELDEHRAFLKEQPGFRDLRITRSINNEGNVLLVIETRWTDDASLVHYETNEPNVAAIVNSHRNVIVADSLQVLDMEALRTESSWRPLESASEAQARVMMPLVVPLGVLALALLFIYGLSRVYLELNKDAAAGLAAGIAIGILAIAFYLANNPRVPGWQIGGIFVIAAAALAGGAIWAVSNKDEGQAQEQVQASPGASPGTSPAASGAPGGQTLVASDTPRQFQFNGQANPTIQVSAGKPVTLTLDNKGTSTHNIQLAGPDGTFGTDDDVTTDPVAVGPGATGTVTFTPAKAGSYDFRCQFHPIEMTGKLEAK